MKVFLPAAGLRRTNSLIGNVGEEFTCWTSEASGALNAWRVTFGSTSLDVRNGISRAYGWSVRLATVVSGLAVGL